MTTKHAAGNKFCCESLIAKLMVWILEAFVLKCKLKMLSFLFVLRSGVRVWSFFRAVLVGLGVGVMLWPDPGAWQAQAL